MPAKPRELIADAVILIVGGLTYCTQQLTDDDTWTSDGALQPPVAELVRRARRALNAVAVLAEFMGLDADPRRLPLPADLSPQQRAILRAVIALED